MNGLFGRLALLAAVVAAVLVAAAGPAYRFGYADIPTAFSFMRFGIYAAGAAGALALVWIVFALVARSTAGLYAFIAALVIAGAAAAVPIGMMQIGASVPAIHDITTDTANPPPFVAIAPLRANAPNGVDYKADENVEPTKQAYPDIQPLVTDVPPADMFKRAEAVARATGWEIVAVEPGEGRIEATDTTLWFGFKDDIVIRIQAEGEGSRLDIRSMSRVGKSDLGKNADRIRKFLAALKEAK
jgi:uncharacterized protein (DUF1499 family)